MQSSFATLKTAMIDVTYHIAFLLNFCKKNRYVFHFTVLFEYSSKLLSSLFKSACRGTQCMFGEYD